MERARAELLGERNHLAREIHDVLAHTLAALSLQLEAFSTVVEAEPDTSSAVREQLERTRVLVHEGLDEARGAVRALRDEPAPLGEQLTKLSAQQHAAFTESGAPETLPAPIVLGLYRVAQEALTNVMKHAPGASASVALTWSPEAVSLSVENDAPVVAAPTPLGRSGGGQGLRGIAERLELLGGAVESGPTASGWRVTASVPLGGVLAPARARRSRVVRVLIADDQRVVREGLATIVGGFPDTEVVGLAGDGVEALELVAAQAPDVVLMDLRMPRMDGVDATRAVVERHPAIPVVVLTTFADDDSILAALTAGAAGYLTKDAARDDIRRALEAAVAGQSVLDPAAQAALLKAAHRTPAAHPTDRRRCPTGSPTARPRSSC